MSTPALTNGQQALGGKDGKVVIDNEIIVRVKQWTVNAVASESVWGDSGSAGYTFRKAARWDATGTIVGVMDDVTRVYGQIASATTDMVGRAIVLNLWEKHANSGRGWYFPCAIISGFDITVDMDTKEVVEYTITWGADGQWYRPGRNGASLQDGV